MDGYEFNLLKRGLEADIRGNQLTTTQAQELYDSLAEIIKQCISYQDAGVVFMPYIPQLVTKTVGLEPASDRTGPPPKQDPNQLFTYEDYEEKQEEESKPIEEEEEEPEEKFPRKWTKPQIVKRWKNASLADLF